MKTGKKVMILLLIFVAAVIVYFIHPVGKKEEHGITEYTAMEKAKFPVLYATMGEREIARKTGNSRYGLPVRQRSRDCAMRSAASTQKI